MSELLNVSSLAQADVGLQAPFGLVVPGKEPLQCLEVYRHLPGKRVVFRAHWGGADALVKLFFQKKYFQREQDGLAALSDSDVPCPKKIWSLTDDSSYFLATGFLPDAVSLEDCYQGLTPGQLLPLLKDAVTCIGQLHRKGWQQADIHLDNFLLSGGKLHVIDGGGIEPLTDEKGAVDNLGLFFAQMVPDYDDLMPEAMVGYGTDAPQLNEVKQAIIRMREKRIQHYQSKSVRSCTQFEVMQSASAFIALQRKFASQALLKLLNEPEVVIGNAGFLKQGNSSTVVKIPSEDGGWVVKRYNIKSFWHGLRRCFRPSRAWVSWKNAYRLELLGIATPKPLAMRENRSGPLRREAYLITEYSSGEGLQGWLLQRGDRPVPQWLDDAVVRMFDIFWHSQVSHGDMKATNLLVTEGAELQLIDLDALTHHQSARKFRKAFAKDLRRFLDNWQGSTWQHFADLLTPLAKQAGCVLKNNRI
ncbi:MAG: hypothetical protein KDI24_06950 [Pseudomonadales bacterium]|nr:hypothetical protein [Pseudomonadales bacterium]